MENSENTNSKDKVKKVRTLEESSIPNFLQKTYEILEDPSLHHIISWNDDGKALVIKDSKLFSDTVLPAHFKHGNISSFIRQLNMYDFKKIKSKVHELMFAHDMFQRGRRDLLRDIRRKSSDVSLLLNKNRINVDDVSGRDPVTLQQENAILKKVQREMMEKIKNLEHRANELSKQNDILAMNLQQAQQNKTNGLLQQQVQQPFVTNVQKTPQFIQVQFPGQIIQPQWNTMATMQNQQNLPQTAQPQGVFAVSGVNADQMNMFTQALPQNLVPQPNQMNFVILPTMQALDPNKQQISVIQNGIPQMTQNGVMIIPQMNAFAYKPPGNMVIKAEEFQNEAAPEGLMYKPYPAEADSKAPTSENQESHNNSEKSMQPAEVKQGSTVAPTLNATDVSETKTIANS